MNEGKQMIQVEVYDELIEIVADKGQDEIYRQAAIFVTERFGAYAKMYSGEKSENTISMMTMLDIALNPMPGIKGKDQYRSFWGRIVDYIGLLKT